MSKSYEVFIKLTLQDGVTAAMGMLSKHFSGLGKQADALNAKFGNLGKIAIGGAALAGVGIGIGKILKPLEGAGEQLIHAKTAFEAALPPASRMADMMKVMAISTKEIGNNMQSSLAGNVEAMHDLYAIVQDIGEAGKLLPAYNILQAATHALGGHSSGQDMASMVRAIELTGRVTPEALNKAATAMAAMTIALRGTVTGRAMMNVLSTSGPARMGYSDEFLTKGLPAIIKVMGNRTGMALYGAYSNMVTGVSSSQAQAQYQEKYGFQSKDNEMYSSRHRFLGFKPGSGFESDILKSNPIQFGNDFRNHLASMGYNTDDKNVMLKIASEMGRGNKQVAALLSEILVPQSNHQLNKEVGAIGKVGGDATNLLSGNDPKSIRNALAKQLDSAMEAVGQHLVAPLMNNVIKPLTNGLNGIANFSQAHPQAIKAIAVGLGTLAAGLVVLGSAAVVGAIATFAGLSVPIAAGFGAISLAATAFYLAVTSPKVTAMFNAAKNGIGGALKAIVADFSAFFSAIGGIAGKIGSFGSSLIHNSSPQGRGQHETTMGKQHQGMNTVGAPPSRMAHVALAHSIHLDGKVIARSMSKHLALLNEHVTSAPAHDGWRGYAASDMQFAAG